MKQLPLNIVLLGDPAAGKATQAVRLAKRYNLLDFDMGSVLRSIQHNPSVAKKYNLEQRLSSGNVAPTELVRGILETTIRTTPSDKGILFDGTPKMRGEALLVMRELRKAQRENLIVLYLTVSLQETVKRMKGRGRSDDTLESLKNRVRYYRKHVSGSIEAFRKQYPFKKISGLGTESQVFARLVSAIKNMKS
jgi:adenylate kinase